MAQNIPSSGDQQTEYQGDDPGSVRFVHFADMSHIASSIPAGGSAVVLLVHALISAGVAILIIPAVLVVAAGTVAVAATSDHAASFLVYCFPSLGASESLALQAVFSAEVT